MRRAAIVCSVAWVLVLAGCAPTQVAPQAQPLSVVEPTPTQVAPKAQPLSVVERTPARAGVSLCRLSNGLTVIVAENHNAPVVCVRAYVRAGGLYEGSYLGSGISHLCEHLVAKGAVHGHEGGAAAGAKQTSSRVDKIGGQSNAYTSRAQTCYYIAATAGKTDDCIDLVADWMARPEITPEDFRREHGVVQRELEMGKDTPSRQMWYAHARNFYGTHPAGLPVIGQAAVTAALTRRDVLDYHRRMYVPRNMVFVVAGDVDAGKVLERVRRAFAGFAPARAPDLSLPGVPPVANTRRVVLTNKSVTQAMQYLSFRTIPLVHDDLYALDVLSYILTNGESSRLVRRIKREQRLVTSIGSSSWTPAWGAGQFLIDFRCKVGGADAAEEAILAELANVVAKGVTAGELARAKRQKVADFVYSQQTVESQAATLATDYLTTGDVEFSRLYADRIQKVTAAQVQAMAEKYFKFDRVVITRMLPAGAEGAAAAAGKKEIPAKTVFFKLPNGLRVVLHSAATVDLVSMALAIRGGLLVETPKTNGMGTLMTVLSTRGAGELSAEEIASFFAAAGGGVAGRCGNNTFYWQATVLADSFQKALLIFADVVQRPSYSDKELKIIRAPLLAQIRSREEDWGGQLFNRFRKDFFRDSPLSMERIGTPEVIKSAAPAAIAAYHKRYLKAGAAVLAVYGKFDPAEARAEISKLFSAMPGGDNKVPQVAARKVAAQGETYVHPSKLEGCAIVVAAPGMRLSAVKDRLAIAVMDTIISGYSLPRGWLHAELRERELVYVVHAYNQAALVPGVFLAYAHCEPDKADLVAGIIRGKYRQTLTHPFSRAEVDEAVNMILTVELLGNQAMSSLAMQAALDELYGFGYDFRKKYEKLLRAITPADVSAAARKYLSGGYVTTIVTPKPELVGKGAK